MAVGTSTGQVLLYDLRASAPFLTRDHRNMLPIVDIKFHNATKNVISSDAKAIKIWNKLNGDMFTSIQPTADINDTCVVDNSGLIMAAGEQHRVQAWYIPALGAAPRWCSFLDSLSEELEESGDTSLYDDYKFVTRDQLESWGLEHLIGSNLLRAYMHGYFMDIRLYERVKAVADPNAYERYIESKVQEKIRQKTENRIVKKKLPAVNAQYAEALLKQPRVAKQAAADGAVTDNPLIDNRFGAMFANKDFEIDVESEEYNRLNPQARTKLKAGSSSSSKADDRFEKVDDIEREQDDADDQQQQEHDAADDSDDDFVHKQKSSNKRSSMAIANMKITTNNKKPKTADGKAGAPGLSMYELKQGFGTATHLIEQPQLDPAQSELRKTLSLAERIKLQQQQHQPSQSQSHSQRSHYSAPQRNRYNK